MHEEKDIAPEMSVVVPCYNSELNIKELNGRLLKTLDPLGILYEIIYVNDASTDNTVSLLKDLASRYDKIIVVDLMYNVGQFRATMCGFEISEGSYVVTLDDDLQHPPEEIIKLYTEIKNNPELDVVIGKYIKKNHSFFRNIGSSFVHRINEKIFKKPKHLQLTAFRCLNRALVKTLLNHRTMFPLIGPLILKSTSNIKNIEVIHCERKNSKSNYSTVRLVKTTMDNIFNFSSLPLKYISLIGIIVSFLSFFMAIFYFIKYYLGYITLPGWITVVLLLNFYSGLILLSIGVIGEYMIRILQEVNHNPRYNIRAIYKKTM